MSDGSLVRQLALGVLLGVIVFFVAFGFMSLVQDLHGMSTPEVDLAPLESVPVDCSRGTWHPWAADTTMMLNVRICATRGDR